MITMKEIAELAGTSRGTVDRVLNGRGNVNPELQARILQIARQNNYHSNPFARALVNRKKEYLIGVVISSIGNRFFDDVLRGIHDGVRRYRDFGISVRIKEVKGWQESEQLQALDELKQHDLSALAVTPLETPAIIQKLQEFSPLPVVTLNTDLHLESKLAFIGCDYLNSGRLCGDIACLASPRGGKIGIVTGSLQIQGHNERISGFRQVVEKTGFQLVDIQENNDDNDTSYRVTDRMLKEHGPDLLYFCAAGTEGGMKAVLDSGQYVKVVVVDDIPPMRRYLNEGRILAIVTQQPYRQGSAMVNALYAYLLEGKRPKTVCNYVENQVKLRHSKEIQANTGAGDGKNSG